MYHCEVVSSVSAIPREIWNTMAPPDDPLWSWSHFRIMEQNGSGPDGFEYLLLCRKGAIIAILPTFWYRAMPLPTASHPAIDRTLDRIRRLVPRAVSLSVYFAGNPLGEGMILSESPVEAAAAAHLAEIVEQRAKHHRLSWVFFKDFTPGRSQSLITGLDDPRFFAVDGLPDASLGIDYPDFEAFVDSRSANMRRNIRKRIRAYDRCKDLRIETIQDFDGYAPEIRHLYETVHARAKLSLDRLSPEYFSAIARDGRIDHRFVACFSGQQMVGFILNVFGGKHGVCFRGGFDYQRSHEAGVYFVLQYESIRQAIAAGVKRLSFCQATYKPKLRLGCDLVPLQHVVTHRNPLLRPLARSLMPRLFARYRTYSGLDAATARATSGGPARNGSPAVAA